MLRSAIVVVSVAGRTKRRLDSRCPDRWQWCHSFVYPCILCNSDLVVEQGNHLKSNQTGFKISIFKEHQKNTTHPFYFIIREANIVFAKR